MYSFGKEKTGVFMLHISLQSLWISCLNINIVLDVTELVQHGWRSSIKGTAFL